ncbi:MAG: hypothetical protein GDA51_11875 [Ekhidna sp.]|nr:hypothetical protein [Ekhidna sp.]
MKKLLNLVFIILGSFAFMYFTSWGSLNPTSFGFYWSIVSSIIIMLSVDWSTNKFLTKTAGHLEKTIDIPLDKDEELNWITRANHFKRWEGVGGKLFLTDRRLVFKSHKFNIQNHEQIFNLNKITKITASNRNRLSFEYEGQIEKFIVSNPDKWSKLLTNV